MRVHQNETLVNSPRKHEHFAPLSDMSDTDTSKLVSDM